jgi:phosphohistidine phosphatase
MTSTLVLLRHAKSAYPPGVPDHERPLSPRGRRDAPVAGELLGTVVPRFDMALVSTATRARQTWELVRVHVAADAVVDVPELYLASPDTMLRRIRDVVVGTLLVVSHNPGTEMLAEQLTANTDSSEYRRMVAKFPTAAFAVLSADEPFGRWGYGDAQLTHFEVGRG